MLAAYGCGWFDSLQECSDRFLKVDKVYDPIEENVKKYRDLFQLYKEIYPATASLNKELMKYRN